MPDKIPDSDHVVRFIPKTKLHREDGALIGLFSQAFELRPDEDFLSSTWIEYFDKNYEEGFRLSAAAIRTQLTVKNKDGFAAGQVGRIKEVAEDRGAKIRILHEPDGSNEGHAALRGWPRDNADLFTRMAADVFLDVRSANSI